MAGRVLLPLLRAGILSRPACAAGCTCSAPLYEAVATTPQHVALARAVAEASTVLLKNEQRALPLRRGAVVALLGRACSAHTPIDPARDA